MQFRNWSQVHSCAPRAFIQPTSEDMLRQTLADAARKRLHVKVVGAGHSWSDVALTDGVLVNLDRMNRVIGVDMDRHRVTVEAGARLRDLNQRLAEHGLALSCLGSISEQSVAGAIGTGTHGSGVSFGSIPTQVVSLRLITASGEVLDIDGGDHLAAARISLGCLGVVTRVTFQCEPAFRLKERATVVSFRDAVDRMDEIARSGEHVKLWWLPHTEDVRVSALDRTSEPATPRTRLRLAAEAVAGAALRRDVDLPQAADAFLNDRLFPGVLALTRRRPSLTPRVNKLLSAGYMRPGERVGRSDRMFNLTMPPIHREMEYGIPREDAGRALAATRDLIERSNLHVNFIVEVRFVAADDIMLSNAYGRDSCQLGAYIGECPSRRPYFDGFESICLAMDGRPHWGKEFSASKETLETRYPRFQRFDAIRRELDPTGRFANSFTRRVFGDA